MSVLDKPGHAQFVLGVVYRNQQSRGDFSKAAELHAKGYGLASVVNVMAITEDGTTIDGRTPEIVSGDVDDEFVKFRL